MEISERYRRLSLIQSIAIFFCGISVFDLGLSESYPKGILVNHLLFHLKNQPTALTYNPFWGEFQFWGYCFILVAFCQILKIYQVDDTLFYSISRISGVVAVISYTGFHLIALLLSIDRFDFQQEAFSSLVDYGTVPSLLTVAGMIVPGLTAPLYFAYIDLKIPSTIIRICAMVVIFFITIMMLSIGLTTVGNEPIDHGVFVGPLFTGLAALLLLFTFVQPKKNGKVLWGLTMAVVGIYVILSLMNSVNLFLAELIIGGAYTGWFAYYGVIFHRKRIQEAEFSQAPITP